MKTKPKQYFEHFNLYFQKTKVKLLKIFLLREKKPLAFLVPFSIDVLAIQWITCESAIQGTSGLA